MKIQLVLLSLLVWGSPALAERALEFAPYEIPADGALILPVSESGKLTGAALAIDRNSGGALARAISSAKFEAESGDTLTLFSFSGFAKLGLVGLGERELDSNGLRDFGGSAAQLAREWKDESVLLVWGDGPAAGAASQIAFGAAMGQYRFDKFKSEEPKTGAGELKILAKDPEAASREYSRQWEPVAKAVRFARDLVSEPANEIYPDSFVARTRTAFEGLPKIDLQVLEVEQMQAHNMGALLGVGRDSSRPPRLLVVRYSGGGRDQGPLAFVGKGITFDSGGISLKTSANMWLMKTDMSGAAAVTATVLALAARGAQVNAVAVAALAENMPSGSAQRPGDVVRTMSGKTVEVINTDAEGRLVLADAVWYAQEEFSPALLVDVATLTGSVRVALGDEYGGLLTRDDALAQHLVEAAASAGEPLWRLPLDPSYPTDIKSDIADIKNVSGHRLAGAGVGAQFIGEFIKEQTLWAHLDIAGVAWRDEDAPTVPKGAVGYGVRLLDQLVRDYYEP